MGINKDVEKTAGGQKKNLSKRKKVLLIVLGILLAVILALTIFIVIPNWGNLKAAWIWLTTSQEDIESKLSENKQQQVDAIKNAGLAGASQETIDALNRGEITQEQFQQILLGKASLEDFTSDQSLDITDDVVSALENGEITGEQFIQIAEKQTTLDEVRNKKPNADKPDNSDENKTEDATVKDAEKDLTQSTGQDKKNDSSNDSKVEDSETSNTPGDSTNSEKSDSQNQPSAETNQSKNESAFTQEAIDAYKNGEITDKQFIEIGKENITLEDAKQEYQNALQTPPIANQPNSQTQPSKPTDSVKTPEQKPEQQTKPSDGNGVNTSASVDEQVASLVTKMYVLKSEYEGSVAGVVSSMKAEYSALPAAQRNTSAKSSIASRYMGTINAMEAQCDAQVNSVVSELRQILKENGRDTSLADSILSTYAAEKENTKAYYLSQYGD